MNCLAQKIALILIVLAPASNAIILLGANNSANQTNPGGGLPFDSVARLSNAAGTTIGGTGVHLGDGYILTANHVGPFSSVTFDGSTFFAHDGVAPVQVGATDMKIFRLTTVPTVGAAQIYTGNLELANSATIVSWGRGRADTIESSVNPNIVPWSLNNTTVAKRWGTNQPKSEITNFSYTFGQTYTFNALQTVAGANTGVPATAGTGVNEAAAQVLDSGSGLFQNIGGTWFLTGITSVITIQNPSSATYGNDTPGTYNGSGFLVAPGTGDLNIFVKVSSYTTQIAAIVPEPGTALLSLLSIPFALRRRR
ncbi:MAG: hypothetical protein H7Y36_07465 [Armatimonadetes bacterium]|nr:hypothetical protein [Akkermansiaceae bacterium]